MYCPKAANGWVIGQHPSVLILVVGAVGVAPGRYRRKAHETNARDIKN